MRYQSPRVTFSRGRRPPGNPLTNLLRKALIMAIEKAEQTLSNSEALLQAATNDSRIQAIIAFVKANARKITTRSSFWGFFSNTEIVEVDRDVLEWAQQRLDLLVFPDTNFYDDSTQLTDSPNRQELPEASTKQSQVDPLFAAFNETLSR